MRRGIRMGEVRLFCFGLVLRKLSTREDTHLVRLGEQGNMQVDVDLIGRN